MAQNNDIIPLEISQSSISYKCYHISLAQSKMFYRTWQSLLVTKYKTPVVLQFLPGILYSDQEPGHNVKWPPHLSPYTENILIF